MEEYANDELNKLSRWIDENIRGYKTIDDVKINSLLRHLGRYMRIADNHMYDDETVEDYWKRKLEGEL